jgi:MurNAc alpha-1-phosphate uridylyltransferase
LPFDYAAPLGDLQAHPEALGTMSVCKTAGGLGPSNVALEGEWVTRYEKSVAAAPLDAVDCGAIALRRSALSDIEDGAVWGIEALFRKLARQRRLRGFVAPERAYDASKPEGRKELERHLQQAPQP